MLRTLDPELRRALAERVRYCHELGIYDFYRRESLLPTNRFVFNVVVIIPARIARGNGRKKIRCCPHGC